jgi:hypothetical protein
MCFSAPASFIASGVLTAAGAVTIAKSDRRSEVPLAAIPLLFGIQQVAEGGVWLMLKDPQWNALFAHAFLLFAYALWPAYLPFAALCLETIPARRKVLYAILAAGVGLGLYLLQVVVRHPVSVHVVGHSLDYRIANAHALLSVYIYLAVTSLCCFASSRRFVRVFGLALLVLAGVADALGRYAFVSVWCFLAAVLSLMIFIYLHRRPAGAPPE